MKPKKIKLMISSRCSDLIKIGKNTISFTDLRKYILEEIEKEKVLGYDLFEVVISEYIVEPTDDTSWNKCLKEIKDSDIVLVWFTGHEGYKDKGNSIGICFAEYVEALQSNPSKVFILDFRNLDIYDSKNKIFTDAAKRKSEFAKEIASKDKWLQRNELKSIKSIDELKTEVKKNCYEILASSISQFVLAGSASLRQSNHLFGEGLVWSKLNYRFRQEAIKHYVDKSVNEFLSQPDFSLLSKCIIVHSLPDSMSISEARELVGRPFLKDIEKISTIDRGPIHIIGVYKTATEKQLRDIIGHQDVAIIQESFGFYVWDLINHIQLIYIINCKDPEVTKLQVQSFFTWLRLQDETKYIIDRAERRFEILKVIDNQKVELKGTLK